MQSWLKFTNKLRELPESDDELFVLFMSPFAVDYDEFSKQQSCCSCTNQTELNFMIFAFQHTKSDLDELI